MPVPLRSGPEPFLRAAGGSFAAAAQANEVHFKVSGLGTFGGALTIATSFAAASDSRVEIKFDSSTLVGASPEAHVAAATTGAKLRSPMICSPPPLSPQVVPQE